MDKSQIIQLIIETINTIFNNLFTSIDNSIYTNLDNIVFVDKSLISNSFFEKLLGNNGKNGLIYLTDALLFGLSIYYCFRLFFAHYTDTHIEKPFQFLFKLFIFTIIVNFSYFIVEQVLNINYLISASIQEIGKNIVGTEISFSNLISSINKSISTSDFNVFSLDGILRSFISVGFVNLTFTYSIRNVLLQVLILFSPFAFLSLINSSTSWVFRSWSRCLFSLLIIQSFVPLVIMIIFSIDDSNKILIVSGIFLLTKINSYIREMFGGLSVELSGNFNNMMSIFKK